MKIFLCRLFSSVSPSTIARKIPLRTKSSYVKRMKLLQSLKDSENECSAHIRSGKFVYFHKNSPFIRRDHSPLTNVMWMSYEATHQLYSKLKTPLVVEEKSVLLNISDNGIAQFALQLHPMDETKLRYLEETLGGTFQDVRVVFTIASNEDLAILSKGASLLQWHRKNLFCPLCGSKNVRNNAGSHRTCTSCKTLQYPQLSPVAIVLVVDQDRCLLVRQPRHPPGIYTAIAGFAEIGESLEETIHREVAEEVGLEVENIDYLGSQYWPFPTSSIMIGCLATVKSDAEFLIDKDELEDAQWFSTNLVQSAADKVKKNPAIIFSTHQEKLLIPPPGPIANKLITTWLQRTK